MYNPFFYASLATTLLISLSCFKIVYIWKKRKLLFINFFSLGITYPLVFIFLSLWYYTHSLFALIVGNILLFVWITLFSLGTFILLFPKKSPLDYASLIFILIPFIYLFTRNIETTFIRALDLSYLILALTFIKLILFGKKPIKIASAFGVMIVLIRIIYAFPVLIELSTFSYIWFFNVFLTIPFVSFWIISEKRPDCFLNGYKREAY